MIRALIATLVASTALVAVGLSTESAHAAGSKNLTVTYSKVMKNEYFYAHGRLSTTGSRTVKLQYKSGKTWKSAATPTMSEPDGRFEILVQTSKTRTYRFYAPKAGSKKAIKGNPKKVTVVPQKVTATVVGTVCSNAWSSQQIHVVVNVTPVRSFREIILRSGGVEFSGYTDKNGNVVLTDPDAPIAVGKNTVKVTAQPYNSSSAKTKYASYTTRVCM